MKKILLIILSLIFYSFATGQSVVSIEQVTKNQKINFNSTIEVKIKVKIEKGWHINSNKPNEDYLIPAKLSLKPISGVKLISVDYPKKSVKEIKLSFSDVPLSVFEDDIFLTAKLQILKDFNPKSKITLTFEYQACNNSTCLPPSDENLSLSFILENNQGNNLTEISSTELGTKENDTASKAEKKYIEQSQNDSTKTKLESFNNNSPDQSSSMKKETNSLFDENNLILSLLLIFLAGLGLNLTPCVYPLIMITVGFFGGQSESKTSKLFILSLLYVLGISLMYSVLGVIAAMTGGIFGSALQNPYVIAVLVLILIAMALSMFGLYEIQPPASLMNKVGSAKSGYLGALLMGLTMGIAAAPCVGPVIISLLSIVGNRGDIFLGFIIFFTLSLGLGLPYLFLGMFSGKIKKLPRSGEWMIGVKKIFGILILGIAIYFLNPLIGEPYSDYTIPIFIIQASMYLAFYDKSGESSKGFKIIKYILIVLAFNYSIYMIIPTERKIETNDWIKPDNINFLEKGHPVILDFYADWCIPCKELDKFTFSDERVKTKLKDYKKFKLNLTKDDNPLSIELTKLYKIKGVPTIILMDTELNELIRLNGFIDAEEFLKILESVQTKK